MSNENKQRAPQGLKEQRARRQRINRIKTGIILFIVIWMSVCMVLNIYLMVRVSSLQNQMEILAEKMMGSTPLQENQDTQDAIDTEQYTQESAYETETVDRIENAEETDESAEKPSVQPNIAIRNRLEMEDNLRSPEDPMTVYLTFDDGPSENTPEILEILKAHNVKATFFVTGKEEDELKEYYSQIVAEGHTLGMHSYSHKYSTIYESVDAFAADFEALRDYIKDLTGVDCKYYRFPGGSSNQVSNVDMNEFIDYLGEQGMTYYDWNVVCGDATSQIYTADELIDNVLTDVVKYKYSVVLMHDSAEKHTTVEALDALLQQLEAMNVEILPITEDSPVIHHNLN